MFSSVFRFFHPAANAETALLRRRRVIIIDETRKIHAVFFLFSPSRRHFSTFGKKPSFRGKILPENTPEKADIISFFRPFAFPDSQ